MGNRVPYLAPELISHVLEQCTSKSTVATAARCSRQYYNIAMPILYNRIDIDNECLWKPEQSLMRPLAILFLSKPRVASYVRHLSVRPELGHITRFTASPVLDDSEWIQDVDTLLDCCDEDRIVRLVGVNDDEVLLALMLPTLPNLVSLDVMGTGYARHMDRVLKRFGTGDQRGSALTNLKSIFWTYKDTGCQPDGYIVNLTIFAMPAIEHIYLHQAVTTVGDPYVQDERPAQVVPHSSTCTHLELRDCRFTPDDLLNLLRIPRFLRVLVYEIGPHQLYYCTVNFSTIRQGVELHKSTLEELCLDYCHEGVQLILKKTDDPANFTFLNDFPCLRRLKLPSGFIVGGDPQQSSGCAALWQQRILKLLPRSIEQLQLTHCEELNNPQITMLLESLARVLGQKAMLVPTLCKIVLEVAASTVNELFADFEQLSRFITIRSGHWHEYSAT